MQRNRIQRVGFSISVVVVIAWSTANQWRNLRQLTHSHPSEATFSLPVLQRNSSDPTVAGDRSLNHQTHESVAAQRRASRQHRSDHHHRQPRGSMTQSTKTSSLLPIPLQARNDNDTVCESPLVFLPDLPPKWSGNTTTTPARRIPRGIHLSMKRRCVHPELHKSASEWHDRYPYDTVYLHDDAAIDRFVLEQDWPEFPLLHQVYRHCLIIGGAVKVDIWRYLFIYQRGGMYADLDVRPQERMREGVAPHADDAAFTLTDGWGRSSQWLFAMEPGHPILRETIQIVLQNLMRLPTLGALRPVFDTGPHAMWIGFRTALANETNAEDDEFSRGGVFTSSNSKNKPHDAIGVVRKISKADSTLYAKTFKQLPAQHKSYLRSLKDELKVETMMLAKGRGGGVLHWKFDLKRAISGRQQSSVANLTCSAAIEAAGST